LHRVSGLSGKTINPEQMKTDLELLVHWNETESNLRAESA